MHSAKLVGETIIHQSLIHCSVSRKENKSVLSFISPILVFPIIGSLTLYGTKGAGKKKKISVFFP